MNRRIAVPSAPVLDVAERLAAQQRSISVSEFFLQNRHLLGFDTRERALLTAVKEAVDNALDACEEAAILPDVSVEVTKLRERSYRVAVRDNGPGIVPAQIDKVFGKLLYGSKFHRLAQSRGTQGIGISAAGMYAQLTTGKPMRIVSRTLSSKEAWQFVLSIDTTKNRPDVHQKSIVEWPFRHGTLVELELEGRWRGGPHSVESYLEATAIANPHATLRLVAPDASHRTWLASTNNLPPVPCEIAPHPHGIELGQLIAMLRDTRYRTLLRFLCEEFSSVGPKTARAIIEHSSCNLTERSRPTRIAHGQAASLHRAIGRTRIRAPSHDCIRPIGEAEILAGLRKEIDADLYFAVSRPPAVYRGNPFVIEVGIAFGRPAASFERDAGGRIFQVDRSKSTSERVPAAHEPARLMRYANRTPLLFQQHACSITRAVADLDWHSYLLDQPKGALPLAPLVLLVHVGSVWVPFTSEAKEAVADYPEITRELRLALRECGRKIRDHQRRRTRLSVEYEHRAQIEKYIAHVGIALQEILGLTDVERELAVSTLDQTLEKHRSGLGNR